MEENWQDNPKLAGMDRSKLDMLQQMAQQGAGKSPSDLLPFIMNAAAKGKSAGLRFNPNEINYHHRSAENGKKPPGAGKIGSGR